MDQRLVLHPEPRLEAVLDTIQEVEAFARANQVSALNIYDLTVAVEELLTNTIMFGIKVAADANLVVSLQRRGESIVCEISDNGVRFDPRCGRGEPNTSNARSQAFPIELLREVAPNLEWRYEEGSNRVRIKYQIGG